MTIDEARAELVWTVDMIPFGASNRPGRPLTPTHITIHNTANAGQGADALAHARYLKGADARARNVSWHYSVDDRRVVQHLRDDEIGWHAGSGNRRSLGIEICEHQGIDHDAANHRAALLAAVLMHIHGIPSDAVVTHQAWTGKKCPHRLLGAPGGFNVFVTDAAQQADGLTEGIGGSLRVEVDSVDTERPDTRAGADGNCAARVRVLERLLGRALAEAELLREELDALKTDTYEAS